MVPLPNRGGREAPDQPGLCRSEGACLSSVYLPTWPGNGMQAAFVGEVKKRAAGGREGGRKTFIILESTAASPSVFTDGNANAHTSDKI